MGWRQTTELAAAPHRETKNSLLRSWEEADAERKGRGMGRAPFCLRGERVHCRGDGDALWRTASRRRPGPHTLCQNGSSCSSLNQVNAYN